VGNGSIWLIDAGFPISIDGEALRAAAALTIVITTVRGSIINFVDYKSNEN